LGRRNGETGSVRTASDEAENAEEYNAEHAGVAGPAEGDFTRRHKLRRGRPSAGHGIEVRPWSQAPRCTPQALVIMASLRSRPRTAACRSLGNSA